MTEPEQIVLTVDRRGNIANQESLPPELLAQLNTPEAQARIQKMYRDAHPKSGRRETRLARYPNGEQRDFTSLRPPWMSREEFRKTRRRKFREATKSALKDIRRERHARTAGQSAGSESDQSNGPEPSLVHGDSTAESADHCQPTGQCSAAADSDADHASEKEIKCAFSS